MTVFFNWFVKETRKFENKVYSAIQLVKKIIHVYILTHKKIGSVKNMKTQ